MSRPLAHRPRRRPRRQFTDEFKAGVVRLVVDEGKTVGAVARDMDLTETADTLLCPRQDPASIQDRILAGRGSY